MYPPFINDQDAHQSLQQLLTTKPPHFHISCLSFSIYPSKGNTKKPTHQKEPFIDKQGSKSQTLKHPCHKDSPSINNPNYTYNKMSDANNNNNNNNAAQQPKQGGGGGLFGGITSAAGGLVSGVGGVASGTVNTVGGVVGNVGRGVGKTISDASSGLENTTKGAGGSIGEVSGAKQGQAKK
jgi:hypothetical protein